MSTPLDLQPNSTQSNAPSKAKKVSFLRLLSDVGSYFFNRHSDATSLTADISALEAQRQAFKAQATKAASDKSHQSAEAHSARIQHLANSEPKLSSPERLQIITPPASLAAAQAAEAARPQNKQAPTFQPASTAVTPTPTVSKAPVAPAIQPNLPPKPVTISTPKPAIETPKSVAKPESATSSAPALSSSDRQELLDKKTRAAHNLSTERAEHTKQILKSKIENRAWNPYGSAQVNLIKEHRSMFFDWQSKMLSMIFFVLLTCLVCVLSYGYLLILEKEKQNSNLYIFTNLDTVNRQIAVVQQELNEKIVPFNDKLMYTGYMLDNHLYWTNFFKFLERETLSDVYYGSGLDVSINGNVKGSNGIFELWSVAKNYNAISNQTKVFAKSGSGYVLSVDATDTDTLAKSTSTPAQIGLLPTDASQAVRFKLKLTIDPRLFLRVE